MELLPVEIIQINQKKIVEIDKLIKSIYRLIIYTRPLGYVPQRIGRICNPSPQRQENNMGWFGYALICLFEKS